MVCSSETQAVSFLEHGRDQLTTYFHEFPQIAHEQIHHRSTMISSAVLGKPSFVVDFRNGAAGRPALVWGMEESDAVGRVALALAVLRHELPAEDASVELLGWR
jgi:hypothetical protein